MRVRAVNARLRRWVFRNRRLVAQRDHLEVHVIKSVQDPEILARHSARPRETRREFAPHVVEAGQYIRAPERADGGGYGK